MGSPTDPIADFLTIVRNGVRAKKERVTTRASNITIKLADILKSEGFIENYKVVEEGVKRFIRIQLRYHGGEQAAIRSLTRVSKPGIHYYVGAKEIPRSLGGLGVTIVSTSKGILTDREARKANLGGEIICKVW